MANIIKGAATVGTPILPPSTATWTDNKKDKTSSAEFFGGKATIYRRAELVNDVSSGLFANFELRNEPEEGETEGTVKYSLSINLGGCATVAIAKKLCEQNVREHISKSNPDLHTEITQAEAAEFVASSESDPW